MFTTKKNLDRALSQAYLWKARHDALLAELNQLIRRINKHGGEVIFQKKAPQLTDEDIKRLLMLCHPDKHGGKQMSVDMTQRLLAIRDRGL